MRYVLDGMWKIPPGPQLLYNAGPSNVGLYTHEPNPSGPEPTTTQDLVTGDACVAIAPGGWISWGDNNHDMYAVSEGESYIYLLPSGLAASGLII
jgi:hypothetical protein